MVIACLDLQLCNNLQIFQSFFQLEIPTANERSTVYRGYQLAVVVVVVLQLIIIEM